MDFVVWSVKACMFLVLWFYWVNFIPICNFQPVARVENAEKLQWSLHLERRFVSFI